LISITCRLALSIFGFGASDFSVTVTQQRDAPVSLVYGIPLYIYTYAYTSTNTYTYVMIYIACRLALSDFGFGASDFSVTVTQQRDAPVSLVDGIPLYTYINMYIQ